MDPFTLSIITGVLAEIISSCICSSAKSGIDKVSSVAFDQNDIEELIRNKIDFETILEKQSSFEDFPHIVKSEGFCKFLKTEEVSCIVQRIYQFDVSTSSDTETLSDLKTEFICVFRKFIQLENNDVSILGSQLFDVLIEACNEVFYKTCRNDDISLASALRANLHHRVLQEDIRKGNTSIMNELSQMKEMLQPISGVQSIELLDNEYKIQLEAIQEQIKDKKPTDALKVIQKLKERIWNRSSSDVKYNLLRLEASANLLLNNYRTAGIDLITARQHNIDDERATVNEAFGYLLCGDKEKSRYLAWEVITKNSTNAQAYSILIQIGFEEDIKKVPNYLKEDQNIAYALGNHYYKLGNLDEAEKWLELSIKNENEIIFEIRPFLALVLLEKVLSDPQIIPGFQLNQVEITKIERSIDLLTFAWESIKDQNLKIMHVDWIINRAVVKRLLSLSKEAEDDVNLAFELDSQNPKCVFFKALIEYENNDFEKVISLSENYKNNDFLRYEALRKLGRTAEVAAEINAILEQKPQVDVKDKLESFLIYIYLELDQKIQAQELANKRYEEEPSNIQRIIDLVRVMKKSGDRNKAISLLEQAKSIISISSKFTDLMHVSDEFFKMELFEDAYEIYKIYVDTTQITELIHKMVDACYLSGDIGKSLEICKSLREKLGPDPHLTRIEVAIYTEINDLNIGKEVLAEYLKAFPDDIEMKLNLSIINQKSGNYREVDKFLEKQFDLKALSVDDVINLAILFNERGFFQKAIEILYELRRGHFENVRVHVVYANLILFQNEEKYEDLLHPKEVGVNSCFVFEDSIGKEKKYIIEDRKDADVQKGELDINSYLSKIVIGKKEGDEFEIKNPVSVETFKINNVESKYLTALQESLDKYNYLYPDNVGFYSIRLPNGCEKLVDTIKNIARLNSERNEKAVKLYLEKKLTLWHVAYYCGRNLLEMWSDFTQNPKLGINCCVGSLKERNDALECIGKDLKMIIDPVSILTLFFLDIGEIITRHFGKFGISQSTVDLFEQAMSSQKTHSRGCSMLYDGENVFLKEISEEEIRTKEEMIKGILDWISKNCVVMPCYGVLSIKRSKKEELDHLFGRAFADTLIIASDDGNILFGEENLFRLIGKQEFNVKGIWTQVLLMYCFDNNIITNNQYLELTIKLANLHYYHTSINAETLIEAAKQVNWKLKSPFINVLMILGGKYCDEESALNQSIRFLSLILNETISLDDFDILVLSLLNIIVQDRFPPAVINKLRCRIDQSIHLFSLDERKEIHELIGVWEMLYYNSPF